MSLVCLSRCVDLLKCRGVILGCVLICLCVWNFPLACLWGRPRPQQWLGRVPGLLCWWYQILVFGGVGFHFPLGCWCHFRATCPWESSTPTPCSCGQVTAWRCGEGAPTISHPYIWSGASSVPPISSAACLKLLPSWQPSPGHIWCYFQSEYISLPPFRDSSWFLPYEEFHSCFLALKQILKNYLSCHFKCFVLGRRGWACP